ncbi:hypothetical protein HDV05_002312 [Chytridiales sp. JEL 0842]|nr:hypothetical protein HDV05_002312 [Chytridiales sp. JEL 0842]
MLTTPTTKNPPKPPALPPDFWNPPQTPVGMVQIKHIVSTSSFHLFSRTHHVLQAYQTWRETVLGGYVSIPDYIKVEKLGYERVKVREEEVGERWRGREVDEWPVVTAKEGKEDWKGWWEEEELEKRDEECGEYVRRLPDKVLVPNDFPYSTAPEEKIQHLLLWSRSKEELPPEEVRDVLEREMPGYEFVYWINPPGRKTIPEINHYHVFAKPLTGEEQPKLE